MFNCMFKMNESMISTDFCTIKDNSPCKLDQIKIFYKNKVKLLTGLEDNTTFEDLIIAVLISNQSNPSKNKHDYNIYQSINGSETTLDPKLQVKLELKRIQQESKYTGKKFDITYSMLPKKLKEEVKISPKTSKRERKVRDTIRHKEAKKQDDLDKVLNEFDSYIIERKNYIKLLEEYLTTLELIEIEQCKYSANHDSDDTGFDSASSTSSTASINEIHIPTKKFYLTNITKLDTSV